MATSKAPKAGGKVAKAPKKAAKRAPAAASGPEKERSAAPVTTMTGLSTRDDAVATAWAQHGDVLTTATDTPVDDTDNSLRVGPRGPAVLQDHHLREKIMHFDHERVPEAWSTLAVRGPTVGSS